MDVKAALTRKIGPLPVWGWAIAVAGAVVAVRIVRGKSALPSGGTSPAAAGQVVGASSGIPMAGESILGQLSASDIEQLREILAPTPPKTTQPAPSPKAIDYAGKKDPLGTTYPSYVHTADQAYAWLLRALANGAHLPKGMTTQQALVH